MNRKHRLTKRQYFEQVYRYGKSAANHQFVLYYMPRARQDTFRFGISVSKKLGKAVVRNKIRRRLKEMARHHAERLPRGFDLIVIARRPVSQMSYREMEKSFLHLLKRAKLPVSQGDKPNATPPGIKRETDAGQTEGPKR